MIIRDAEIADVDELDRLLTLLIRDESKYDVNLNNTCMITDNYCSRIGLDGHKILVAEENGQIAGFLYGFIYHIPNITLQAAAILDALYIVDKYRGKGCATALITQFKHFAKENNACRIELKVFSENGQALKLYEKLSFREEKKYMYAEL